MEFLKFITGYYWNDTDSKASGYRSTLIFCWVMWTFAGFSTAVIALAILGCR
jgi:hypothetical protein